ncbi:MAG TPA: hypothetical protein VK969_03540, partial [Acidimicrobiia bacterium]|nr:hypothetical protein [Acidimicrobiia bacterium]
MPGDEKTDTHSDLLLVVQNEMLVLQEETLDWMELGMVSWFHFYFAIGPGTMDDRLSEASAGLGKASDRLDTISAQMKYLPVKDSTWERPAQAYRE